MNNPKMARLTLIQYILFIHSIQTASGLLVLPNTVVATAGTDGWISIVLGWIVTNIVGVLIIFTMNKNPNMNFFDLMIQCFGKWLGKLMILLYSFYLAFAGVNTLLKVIDMVKVWIFPSMPSYQIIILLIIPFYILARDGIQAIARYNEFVFLCTLMLPAILLLSLKSGYYPLHLLPVIKHGWFPVLQGVKEMITPYAGLEIAYFLYPFLQKKEKAVTGIIIANTLTMLLMLYVTILCFLHFSPEGMHTLIWPVFYLLKGIRFAFLERFEIIYTSYYLLVFSTTFIPYLYFATYSVTAISKKIHYNKVLISFILIIISIFFFLRLNSNQFIYVYEFTDKLNLIFFIIIPILLYIYVHISNMHIRRKHQ
ncbi:endospore germination permease [Bacillus sp. DX1.1]|uniref:GerAB/ArcD/ProY family transporter n=1 Tax=unclassified Bacillus (in: firmicutes) TaxID=185979 RepID=UPI00256FD439|nr:MULTISPECIES: endospore germination permease [unclassified Bacillus (in: firmicutes)]MDM5155304.1 endospore germination permease [Bacillus sp. DX1.1]WJE79622.1 endospore germination permease [Bacillus sp. DX3.1]